MEGYARGGGGAHQVVCLPFPAQGHLNPMIQFSKRLASKGFAVALIFVSDKPSPPYTTPHGLTVFTISLDQPPPPRLDDYVQTVRFFLSKRLPELLSQLGSSPRALVFDSVMPWALDIARSFGLFAAVLLTQPWCVNAVYYHVSMAAFSVPSSRDDDHPILASFPSLPLLRPRDLPCFAREESSNHPIVQRIMIDQPSHLQQVDLVLCNSFDKLEEKVLKWIQSLWPVMNIGPTVPSMYLDKRLSDDKDYGLSLFNPQELDLCLTWLDSKPPGSVVYVSFGSITVLGDKQLKEVASGLKQTGHFFLWVVRETETEKLPRNYSEEVSEKGFIVTWSPQLQVLAHKSVGCFVTHCGWNSTIEALSLGVTMVGIPQWTDQPTNAKFVEDVWKVGVRAKADRDGFVTEEEIARCVGEVMGGENAKEIRRNAEKWKQFAREAVSRGGSSDKNIDEIVARLCQVMKQNN